MIGIDRQTGRTIHGHEQFISRVEQVMTTPFSARIKRGGFGSKVPHYLSANTSDSNLGLMQAAAIEAFYHAPNGIGEFAPDRCVAKRHADGVTLHFYGELDQQSIKFEVTL